jgi:tRNA (cmo5U34)-methyltransferase
MRQKSQRERIRVGADDPVETGRMGDRDSLYQSLVNEAPDFVFDERVVRVFPDMVNRSIPGYGVIVPMAGLLARRYAQEGSTLYDLGCSLGAVALAMSGAVRAAKTRIVAVDNSPAMIARLRELLATEPGGELTPIDAVCADVMDTPIQNGSVAALNFTLQFVEPSCRLPLLTRVAAGLLPGGVLLLSEKMRFDSTDEQALQTEWHHDFKRAQGYSELEIAHKRDALENVMKPDTLEQHRKRLLEAGFSKVHQWFQAFNFASLIAFR